ncbi:unnamed protein product [Vitrella brassicaformis CCMP3155]|uniref:RxLR effector protein n=1 Tax=Vitrella brassicaformis (strain CCMP3155) TaxID=1169540 RepID=A0A0G4FDE5_VITBC|nr:unnamed protein product [Vitrella brassicaformis CCMP3155]|eukprot:CEM11259.1 unnamed protein product [Vitrella brassicaformis CCMP3155]
MKVPFSMRLIVLLATLASAAFRVARAGRSHAVVLQPKEGPSAAADEALNDTAAGLAESADTANTTAADSTSEGDDVAAKSTDYDDDSKISDKVPEPRDALPVGTKEGYIEDDRRPSEARITPFGGISTALSSLKQPENQRALKTMLKGPVASTAALNETAATDSNETSPVPKIQKPRRGVLGTGFLQPIKETESFIDSGHAHAQSDNIYAFMYLYVCGFLSL